MCSFEDRRNIAYDVYNIFLIYGYSLITCICYYQSLNMQESFVAFKSIIILCLCKQASFYNVEAQVIKKSAAYAAVQRFWCSRTSLIKTERHVTYTVGVDKFVEFSSSQRKCLVIWWHCTGIHM